MKGLKRGIVILLTSVMITTPVMAATVVNRDIMKPNDNVMLPSTKMKSSATFITPNYVGQKLLKVGNYPYEVGEIQKENTVVVKRSPDGNVFKLSIDANEYQNVHSVEIAGNRPYYYKEYDEYAPGRLDSWGPKVFKLNGSKKEVVISRDFLGITPQREDEMFGFYLVLLDRNGNELYYISHFNLLLLNQGGKETLASHKEAKTARPIDIEINGKKLPTNVSPIQDNGSVFVPMRAVSEYLGAAVNYDQKNKDITLAKNNQVIKLKIDTKKASINGNPYTLPAVPRLVKGTTYVPIRMIAETFNSDVQWDGKNQKVIIITK